MVNKQAARRVKLAVRAFRDALAADEPDWAEVERLRRAAQKLLSWAGARRYLHPNKASRLVSRLSGAVTRAKTPPSRNGRTVMRWFQQLQALMARTAAPAARLASLRAGLDALRTRYSNRWVFYRDVWDAGRGQVVVHVLGDFPTRQAAVDWSFTLSDDEREHCTLVYAAPAADDARVNPQAVRPKPA